jgi:SGNH domain (fused to AT3 domains)
VLAANWEGKIKTFDSTERLLLELDETVKYIDSYGIKTYIVGDVPQFDFDPQRCKFQRPLTQNTKCDAPIDLYFKSQRVYVPTFEEVLRQNTQTSYVDPTHWMCNQKDCSMVHDGMLMYRDGNHLNIQGSKYVAGEILKQYPDLDFRIK